jgi:hypothetical protein
MLDVGGQLGDAERARGLRIPGHTSSLHVLPRSTTIYVVCRVLLPVYPVYKYPLQAVTVYQYLLSAMDFCMRLRIVYRVSFFLFSVPKNASPISKQTLGIVPCCYRSIIDHNTILLGLSFSTDFVLCCSSFFQSLCLFASRVEERSADDNAWPFFFSSFIFFLFFVFFIML